MPTGQAVLTRVSLKEEGGGSQSFYPRNLLAAKLRVIVKQRL